MMKVGQYPLVVTMPGYDMMWFGEDPLEAMWLEWLSGLD